MRIMLSLLTLLLLSACSGTPVLETDGVNLKLTPAKAKSDIYRGSRVAWGGVIINSTNLKSRTRIEVLAYPLDSDHRPQTHRAALGRFFAYEDGYLETVDYAPGRRLSMVGTVESTERARLGEHHYNYPSLKVEQLHLWPLRGEEGKTRLHFGIGVILHN